MLLEHPLIQPLLPCAIEICHIQSHKPKKHDHQHCKIRNVRIKIKKLTYHSVNKIAYIILLICFHSKYSCLTILRSPCTFSTNIHNSGLYGFDYLSCLININKPHPQNKL